MFPCVPSSTNCDWLYTLVSGQHKCYLPFPQIQQAHKYKDTPFGSLPCLMPVFLLFFRCVTGSTSSFPCKQVLFVLSDYKYCFGKIIVKKTRQSVFEWTLIQNKIHDCTVWRHSFFTCIIISGTFPLFGFIVKAQSLEWKGSGRRPKRDPFCAHRDYGWYQHYTYRGTLTDEQYCRAIYIYKKKTLRNGENILSVVSFIKIFPHCRLSSHAHNIPFLSKVRGCRCCFSLATLGGAVPLCRWLTGGYCGCVYCYKVRAPSLTKGHKGRTLPSERWSEVSVGLISLFFCVCVWKLYSQTDPGGKLLPVGAGSGEDVVEEELGEEQNAEDEAVTAGYSHTVICGSLSRQLTTQSNQVPASRDAYINSC